MYAHTIEEKQMKKPFFYLICAVMSGIIVDLCGLLARKFGIAISEAASAATGFIVASAVFILCIPELRKKLHHWCCDLDWADEICNAYNTIPRLYRKSFWQLFGFINLAFLFHTVNFMWGAGDWGAIRFGVNPDASLASGRFSAWWLQKLLFDGEILPVINNLWAFAGLALAGVLLGIYWQLPQRTTAYVVTGLFFIITPYTLGWLYTARDTLSGFWLPALSLTALLLSDCHGRQLNAIYLCNLASVFLFITAFGTWLPIINFIGVALLGKVFIKTVFADISLKSAFKRVVQAFADLTAAMVIYAFIIFVLKDTGIIETHNGCWFSTVATLPSRLPDLLVALFTQFATPIPFAGFFYKLCYLAVMLTALFALIFKSPNTKAAMRGMILIPLILLASRLSTFFILPAEEETISWVRTDFYGLPLIYALSITLILKLGGSHLKRISYTLALILIFASFVRVAYALKVWKFGWDAETKLAERIITRLEKMPEFNVNGHYKLLQIGEQSLRGKYYLKKRNEKKSGELLAWAYYPAGAAKDAYNFYYQSDFLAADARLEEAVRNNSALRSYILNRARPWPAKDSLFISGDYIVLVLDEDALARAQSFLTENI